MCMHQPNQCAAVAGRVAASMVRWQLEARIKAQPLCYSPDNNIELGATRHFARHAGGSLVSYTRSLRRPRRWWFEITTLLATPVEKSWGGRGLGPEVKNQGTSLRRTKALTG